MKRKKYLIELMNTTKARHSELVRWYSTLEDFRHVSTATHIFYMNLIELNKTLADRAENELYIFHKYGRRNNDES